MSWHISDKDIEAIKQKNEKRRIQLPDGTRISRIGQGTWNMGDAPAAREEEIAALRLGVELGLNLIDTAEMYGDGRSEDMIAEAIQGIRDEVFLVSKVYPHNAGKERLAKSCEDSLKRLGTDRLDLYLLHWRGDIPLEETVEEMEKLVEAGKILRWGVSNFDIEDMQELQRIAKGSHCAVNQVLYHLGSRGIENELLPWMTSHKIPVMAYSPLAQAGTLRKGLVDSKVVQEIAAQHGITPLQLLLAWTIREDNLLTVPKASSRQHVLENAAVAAVVLSSDDQFRLDDAFPRPAWQVPLDMI